MPLFSFTLRFGSEHRRFRRPTFQSYRLLCLPCCVKTNISVKSSPDARLQETQRFVYYTKLAGFG